ncbi:Disease resistance protein (CC-NBS-LRR class) family [Arabidopsis thaliana]|uniref:Disease resistance protein (CC-NBS-LRR class) family n=1 Tax=Arabidopsis thaliana TaxID=3702 RepID=A0A1P8AWT5_ARATH|nr:Disease resistance protein (CC-NBS-LRR class) family [Arabidopsis thaliana]ANM61067.1 Disease resistance protein (CC-NBS-LRR class) family [Arabidopsis thaliana]|eukprot:NP_001323308.1 Disease resistance protein (CC-NBS-LRR class) family [Arabidopsis thaliana]
MELVSFGVEKLWDRLSQEYDQFKGVEDQVTELKSNLNLLKSFLKDADAKKHISEMVRHCVEEIKDIVYDTEDIIETFILKEKVEMKRGIMKRIKRFASTIMDRRELASDIGGISKRISKVIQDMQSFGVQQIITDGSRSSHPLQERQREMRHTFSRDSENDFVGMEANVKKLVGYLVEKDDYQIVSLTGMGGLGKTTLARQVFNHDVVKDRFDGFAWVSVSQEFTRISVWQTILQNLTSKERKDEIQNMKEADLHDDLFRLLESSKTLIVLDDIWKEEDWDLIKPIFPPKKGWKVLLTSRTESIAMRGDTTYISFKPKCLSIPDSWTLFQSIAMPRKDTSEFKVDEEMENMGKKMIKHCGGLSLAVKVLGGLLAAKYTLHDWKRLSENIGSHIVERTSEDHEIDVEKLHYYWAAEGISERRRYDGETIRDTGDSYIEELVRRNMVISERDVMTSRFETCRLHDMMREICLFKAKEENFLQIVSNHSPTSNPQTLGASRRFVLHNPTTLHVERYKNNPKLRSLVVVYDDIGNRRWMLSGSIFTRVKLLRVLDLVQAKFKGGKLPSDIGKLIHLRYLSLKDAKVSHLPSSLRNLVLLIYLDIRTDFTDIFVPNVFMGMRELRYLELPRFMHEKTKLELSNLEKLEALENFSTKSSSLEDLRGMVRLRTLVIILSEGTSLQTLSASVCGLRHLENFKIMENAGVNRMGEERMVLDFTYLKKLTLSIEMPRLPKIQHLPSHLTVLDLSYCCLEEDPMPILEKLLELKDLSLDYLSFSGRKMVCSAGGFPQLRKLALDEQEEWEEWIVEEGSMSRLHTLSIWSSTLKELPDGLRFIYSLKNLIMGKSWMERLSERGEEFYKVQNIPFIKFSS